MSPVLNGDEHCRRGTWNDAGSCIEMLKLGDIFVFPIRQKTISLVHLAKHHSRSSIGTRFLGDIFSDSQQLPQICSTKSKRSISNIADTSINVKLSSIHFHTKRLYIILSLLWKRIIDRLLITLGSFQDKRKYSAYDLKCRYCVFTLWARNAET